VSASFDLGRDRREFLVDDGEQALSALRSGAQDEFGGLLEVERRRYLVTLERLHRSTSCGSA